MILLRAFHLMWTRFSWACVKVVVCLPSLFFDLSGWNTLCNLCFGAFMRLNQVKISILEALIFGGNGSPSSRGIFVVDIPNELQDQLLPVLLMRSFSGCWWGLYRLKLSTITTSKSGSTTCTIHTLSWKKTITWAILVSPVESFPSCCVHRLRENFSRLGFSSYFLHLCIMPCPKCGDSPLVFPCQTHAFAFHPKCNHFMLLELSILYSKLSRKSLLVLHNCTR